MKKNEICTTEDVLMVKSVIEDMFEDEGVAPVISDDTYELYMTKVGKADVRFTYHYNEEKDDAWCEVKVKMPLPTQDLVFFNTLGDFSRAVDEIIAKYERAASGANVKTSDIRYVKFGDTMGGDTENKRTTLICFHSFYARDAVKEVI